MNAQAEPVPTVVLAADRNDLIGAGGTLPWRVPGELAHFKRVTMGKPVVMGRKTFDSIGRPLPGRTNVVVTRDPTWRRDGVTAAHALDDALEIARVRALGDGVDEICLIGGAELVRAAMPRVGRVRLTRIDAEYEGDTWLEGFEPSEWVEVERHEPDPATTGDVPIAYLTYERVGRTGGDGGVGTGPEDVDAGDRSA